MAKIEINQQHRKNGGAKKKLSVKVNGSERGPRNVSGKKLVPEKRWKI